MNAKQKPLKITRPKKYGTRRKWLIAGGAVLVVLVVSLQAALFWDLYNRTNRQVQESSTLKALIATAINGESRQAVIDPVSNKIYLPQFRLVMQGDKDSPELLYGGDDQEVTIAKKVTMNAAVSRVYGAQTLDGTFAAVPNLQACSHQVALVYGAGDAGSMLNRQTASQFTQKKLADGRTVYAYYDSSCAGDGSDLVALVKTIQSY